MMAHCVLSMVVDTDRHNEFLLACMVHTMYAPCRRGGQPATATPLHAWSDQSREASVQMWEIRTDRQRPLMIHHGGAVDAERHDTDADDCWCGPELVAARTT